MNHSNGGMAGAATVNITPIGEIDSWGGTSLRRNEEEDSDLLAHAVVFTDGDATGALVSLDMAILDRAHALAMREACAVRTGITAEHITIAVNHAHMSPRAAPGFVVNRGGTDCLYVGYLCRRVVEAVAVAKERMRPARIVFGNAPTTGKDITQRRIGNKGVDCAEAALEMVDLMARLPDGE